MIRSLTGLLDEWMPIVAGSEINDDPYEPVSRHRARPGRRARRRDADRVDPSQCPLRREAGHPGHVDRRSHRRGRSDQGGRGPLPGRRADAALRPRAPHQPRHLRHERTARPRRAHPGRSAQRARRARCPDPWLQDPAPARRHAVRVGQPGGLHEPRPVDHTAQGPFRFADPHALPARRRDRDGHRRAGGAAARGDRDVGRGAGVHGRDRCHHHAAGPAELTHQPAVRRVGPAVGGQPRDAGRERRSPVAAPR